MRQKYSKILVLFLAALIFFVGAGVTVINLCCTGCIDKLMSMQMHQEDCSMPSAEDTSHSCCSKENADTKHLKITKDDHYSTQYKGVCCQVKRVSMDIDNSVYHTNLLQSTVWVNAPSFIESCVQCLSSSLLHTVANPSDPVPIPPRHYLSLIRVLII